MKNESKDKRKQFTSATDTVCIVTGGAAVILGVICF